MSWSVSAVGKPKAVAAAIAAQAANNKCKEPEEGIKSTVVEIVATACNAMPEGSAVEVTASGSMQCVDYNDPSKGNTNQLTVSIKPLFGFVE